MSIQRISSTVNSQVQQSVPEFTADTKNIISKLFKNRKVNELIGECSTLVKKAHRLDTLPGEMAKAKQTGNSKRNKALAIFSVATAATIAYFVLKSGSIFDISSPGTTITTGLPIALVAVAGLELARIYDKPTIDDLKNKRTQFNQEVPIKKQELGGRKPEMKRISDALDQRYVEAHQNMDDIIAKGAENTLRSRGFKRELASLEKARNQFNNLFKWILE